MAIQRLLLRSGQFTHKQREKLDAYFGSPEGYDLLYRSEPDLFGDASPVKVEESGQALVSWYRERLRKAFGCASDAALIRNTKGGHLYYLLLATPNRTGLKIANDILSASETVLDDLDIQQLQRPTKWSWGLPLLDFISNIQTPE